MIIASWEFYNMSNLKNNKIVLLVVFIAINFPIIFSISIIYLDYANSLYFNVILGFFVAIFLLLKIFQLTKLFFHIDWFFWIYIVFFGFCLGLIPYILSNDQGHWHLLFLLTIIWITDTGSYFVGNFLGRHKLPAFLSKKKSVEGVIGGVVSGVVYSIFFLKYFHLSLSTLQFFLVVILIPITAVAGDLFESFIKRRSNIKNSSKILLGHGGVLDRLDSMVPNVLMFYLISG
tara:strand:- start:389 stop:1084 length:696 start_codon:yes stop_codon:yes gene_type:complete